MTQKKIFDTTSPGFWTTILSAILSITSLMGIQYPLPPDQAAEIIVDTFTSGGIAGLIGILFVNVIGPIYNFIRKKQGVNWKVITSSVTFWVSLGNIFIAAFALATINIPPGTPAEIVAAITARDWALLAALVVGNIAVPIIRYLKQKAASKTPA